MIFRYTYIVVPLLFCVAVVYLARQQQAPSLAALCLAAAAIMAAVPAVRLRWLFVVPVYWIVHAVAIALTTARARREQGARSVTTVVLIPALLLVIGAGFYTMTRREIRLRGDLVRENYPMGAAELLREADLGGNLFNPYNWGGYLIYQLAPRYRVFIDGRTILYSTAYRNLVRDYITIENRAADYEALLDTYDVDILVAQGRHFFPRGRFALEHHVEGRLSAGRASTPQPVEPAPDWIPVLLNGEGSIYVADRAGTESLRARIETYFGRLGVRWSPTEGIDMASLIEADPARAARFGVIPADLWAQIQNSGLDPNRSMDPDTWAEAEAKWGQALLAAGLIHDAAQAFDTALIRLRYDDRALLGGAYAHHLIGNNDQAKRYLERLRLFGDDPRAGYVTLHATQHVLPPSSERARLPPLARLVQSWPTVDNAE